MNIVTLQYYLPFLYIPLTLSLLHYLTPFYNLKNGDRGIVRGLDSPVYVTKVQGKPLTSSFIIYMMSISTCFLSFCMLDVIL